MRIFVIGSGGREHALAWVLARHGHAVTVAPGNPGCEEVATRVPVKADDLDGLIVAIERDRPDLVVVGPEAPLVAGLADAVRAAGVACFGPGRDGSRLEGSKAFCKEFFARHGIPTAPFRVCASVEEADAAIAVLCTGAGVVVKADGLAAGKGVVVARDAGEACAAARRFLVERTLGEAGATLVVEARLPGREASILAITDGERFVLLPPAEDHKAVFDGDEGPNTGGMGVVSPTPVVGDELLARVAREVLAPTVAGLRAEGVSYRGVLYAGLMVAPDGTPHVLEYNCRFGDPETEPLVVRWQDDPARWLDGAARGALPDGAPSFTPRAAVCVIAAAAGYPDAPRAGDAITGLAEAAALGDVTVFQAGTRRDGERLVTAGGRVLAITALGDDVAAARARAYQAAARIHFDGMHVRRDIGARR